MLSATSFFFNRLAGEKRDGCVTLVVFLMSCSCYRSMTLPHNTVGLICVVAFAGYSHLIIEGKQSDNLNSFTNTPYSLTKFSMKIMITLSTG